MTPWQRRARAGVLIVGLSTAGIVYLGVRERKPLASNAKVTPLEPHVIAQTNDGSLQFLQSGGTRETFSVRKAQKIVAYDDGSTRFFGIEITSTNRDGRQVTVSAPEGFAGKGNKDLRLTGGVRLIDSTGFELLTSEGTFNQDDLVARAAGEVSFSKGRMHGNGVGMSYNQQLDVLRIDDQAYVAVEGQDGGSTMQFTATTATLDRMGDLLTLEGGVHGEQGRQITDADIAVARLTPAEDVVTFVELRGNSRVSGGVMALEDMSARDIDLDYTDDGKLLERARLTGGSTVNLTGENNAAGRTFTGDQMDIALAPDGSLSRLQGERSVRLVLPAMADAPKRTIQAEQVDARGGGGGTLGAARFENQVVFREESGRDGLVRIANSRVLNLALEHDDVTAALFTGGVTFTEDDLKATAEEAEYQPAEGMLRLKPGGAVTPAVSDRTISIGATAIDVGLGDRGIEARGRVKTFLRAGAPAPGASGAPGHAEAGARGQGASGRAGSSAPGATRLPGLFTQNQPANVTADRLSYLGSAGTARYTGSAWLWQDDKEVRADAIDIDQDSGDLTATGRARSTLVFDTGRSEGQAQAIRYVDAARIITYSSTAASASTAPATSSSTTSAASSPAPRPEDLAHLQGPQGDLRADVIVVHLAATESRVERIEARRNLTALVDAKTIEGDSLEYRAAEERYDVVGTPKRPMRVRTDSCKESTGRTLTFVRSADTMSVDGRRIDGRPERRTDTRNPCRSPTRP